MSCWRVLWQELLLPFLNSFLLICDRVLFAKTKRIVLFRFVSGVDCLFLRSSTSDVSCLGHFASKVKIRGFRLELGEVEAQLEAFPEVPRVEMVEKKWSRWQRWIESCEFGMVWRWPFFGVRKVRWLDGWFEVVERKQLKQERYVS